MGTEILRPQDCLARHAPNVLPRRRFNSIPNPNSASKLCRKSISPDSKRRKAGSPKPAKVQQKQLVMGQLRILKRGEPIDVLEARIEERDGNLMVDGVLFGTGPLGPEPAMIPKHIRVASCPIEAGFDDDGYAGSAFSISPSPRSLPLPSFSKGTCGTAAFEKSSASAGLRRLLRLD